MSNSLPPLDPNAIPVGYINIGDDGSLVSVNKAFASYLGVGCAAVSGRNLFDFLHSEDDTATFRTILAALFQQPQHHRAFDLRLQSADSTMVTLSFRDAKLLNPTVMEFWVHDISQNAQAIDKGRATRQRYDMALQATSDGLFDWDITSNSLWSTKRFRELLGTPDQETSDDPRWFFDRIHPEDLEKAQQFTSITPDAAQHVSIEVRLRSDHEQYRWYQVRAVCQFDDQDQMTRMVGALTDIDELRRSVDALAESASMNAAILNNVFDALITIDAFGEILLVNPAAETMFGFAAAEMIGQNVSMLMPPSEGERHDGYIEAYKSTNKANIIGIGREVIARRKNGQHFPINLGISQVYVEGQRLFIGTIHDLTETRRAETTLRHAQKMEALGQLTGGVAHDFNNLLTVVLGNLEMLEDEIPEGENLDILREAIEGATSGADLTRRLLTFSRKQPSSPAVVGLNETVDRMMPMMRRAIREHIDITLDCAATLPDAFADSSQLDNSLLNLVLNARDAMPHGGEIVISTRLRHLDITDVKNRPNLKPGAHVVLAVRDNGSGIPLNFHDRIFEPFFTSKAGEKGSGLGLSMVYGFAQQSGGHIEFSSTTDATDHGTEFRIFLPVTSKDTEDGYVTGKGKDMPKGRGEKVLVVEDHPKLRQTASRMIKDLGYQVLDAADEDTAITMLENHHIDLVFTDMVLIGGGSGRSIIERVKATWPHIALVMTSGYTEDEAWTERPDADIPFLHKPWRKQEVALAFDKVLATKQGRQD